MISANGRVGVYLQSSGNRIQGNRIGTDVTGTVGLGNAEDGVLIANQHSNLIGGPTPGAGNLISGNGQNGIEIAGNPATENSVQGNFIGTDMTGTADLGNQGDGIRLTGPLAFGNPIGGSLAGAGNRIAFNGGAGVAISGANSIANPILSNSIFSNVGIGIDLGGDGPTPNDSGDFETGPNDLQNFPVLASAVVIDDRLMIEGSLNSTPNTRFRLEFFSNTALDATGYGEGGSYLESTFVTTDSSGYGSFAVTSGAAVPPGSFITATATDPQDNTSEFSPGTTVSSEDPVGFAQQYGQAGPLLDDAGQAITTDAAGNVYVTGLAGYSDATGGKTSDFFAAKYSPGGVLLWQTRIGSSGNDRSTGITVDSDGRVYVTGYFQGTVDFDPLAPHAQDVDILPCAGVYDIFVLKLDGTGRFEWAKRFGQGNGGYDHGLDIVAAPDGRVYVAGLFSGGLDFDPGVQHANDADMVTAVGGYDAFVLALNRDGGFQWVAAAGGSGYDSANGLAVDPEGHVFATGVFQGEVAFDRSGPDNNLAAQGQGAAFVWKLAAQGGTIAAIEVGDSTDDESDGYASASGIAFDSHGFLYVTGRFNNEADFNPDPAATVLRRGNNDSYDAFVLKLDSSLSYAWVATLGSYAFDAGLDVAIDAFGNVLVGGYFQATVDFDPSDDGLYRLASPYTSGIRDGFLLGLSPDGDFQWATDFGSDGGDDLTTAVTASPAGAVLATGYFCDTVAFDHGDETTTLTSTGGKDAFVVSIAAGVRVSSAPTIVDLATAGDTGASDADGLTRLDNSDSASRLSFSVQGTTVGATVTVYANGLAIGSAVASSDVTTVTTNGLSDLADGTHIITARQAEPDKGRSPDSPPLTIRIDTTAPRADVVDVSPDPRDTAVSTVTIKFSEPVAGFDMADVSLTRNGSAISLSGASLTTGDQITWTLGRLDSLTGTAGLYSLDIKAVDSGIQDAAGNPLQTDAADTWTVETAAPPTKIDVELVVTDTANAQDRAAELPASMETIWRGQTFFVEVWVTNVEGSPNGITGGFLDLSYDHLLVNGLSVSHGGLYTDLTAGTVDNAVGLIDEFGGNADPGQLGLGATGWVRLGYVSFTAAAEGLAEFRAAAGDDTLARAAEGGIAWSDVEMNVPTTAILIQSTNCIYDIDQNDIIGTGDYSYLSAAWHSRPGEPAWDPRVDFDGDGLVGTSDFSWLSANWHKSCSDPTIVYPSAPGQGTSGEGEGASGSTLHVLAFGAGEGESLAAIDVELVPVAAPSLDDTSQHLPARLADVSGLGETFFVEIWAKNLDGSPRGITGGYVVIAFDPSVVAAGPPNHGGLYTNLASGLVDNAAGMVVDLGGNANPGIVDKGADEWVRLGYVPFTASAAGKVLFAAQSGSDEFARAGEGGIAWSNIELNDPIVTVMIKTNPTSPAVTVNSLVTREASPVLTGTVSDGDLQVVVNGRTYTPGDGQLTVHGTDWALTIPPADRLADGIYDVIASSTDQAGSLRYDGTSNELIVDTAPPVATILRGLGVGDRTSGLPIVFVVEFTEPVTGVTVEDVVLSGTTSGATVDVTGSGAMYEISISGLTIGTTIVVDLASTVCDAAGNASLRSSDWQNRVTYKPWTNVDNPSDVDGSGNVAPLDVLALINRINTMGSVLPSVVPDGARLFYDVDADGFLTALDVLLVINEINADGDAGGEAEGPLGAAATLPSPYQRLYPTPISEKMGSSVLSPAWRAPQPRERLAGTDAVFTEFGTVQSERKIPFLFQRPSEDRT